MLLDRAREMGATRVYLESNTILDAVAEAADADDLCERLQALGT